MSLPKYLNLKNFHHPGGSAMSSQLIIKNYSDRYDMFIAKNIKLKAYKDGKSYVFLASVPSEKNHKYRTNIYYDVIVEFYPVKDIPNLEEDKKFMDYGMRVYSNMPTCTFTFTYVYHKIGALYKKIPEKLYSEKALEDSPNQTNPVRLTGIEKSIWCTLRKIYEVTKYSKDKFESIREIPEKKDPEFKFPGKIFDDVMSQMDKLEEIHNTSIIKKSKFKGATRREFRLGGKVIGAENRTSKKSKLENVIQRNHENETKEKFASSLKSTSLTKNDEVKSSALKESKLKSNSFSAKLKK